jgi:hypothetical protein
MKRHALGLTVTLVCGVVLASSAFAQARPGAQAPATKAAPVAAAPAPAAPAKFSKMFKGTADIEIIKGVPKRIGPDIVTVLKLKNMSPGPISLLKVDEYWYDHNRQVVSGDSQAYRKPFQPGEIIEITMKSPVKPDLYQNQFALSHANGQVKVKAVKKFE